MDENIYHIPEVDFERQKEATNKLLAQKIITEKALAETMENGEILFKLVDKVGEMGGKMSEGFSAIHQRLDTLNHRTEKSELRITSLEKGVNIASGGIKAYAWLWSSLLAIGSILISLYVAIHYGHS